ncbi:MAG: PepSY domain-containing protein, partial [Mycetocola sp.]
KTIWISAAVAAALVLGGTGVAVAVTEPFDTDDSLSGTALEKASAAALAEVGKGSVTDAESDDDAAGGYEVEVTLEDGTQVDVHLDKAFEVTAVENENSKDEADDTATDDAGENTGPLTDADKASAEKAALAEVPGTVTDVDRSDDTDHAYEVEVTREDGTDVDVELDEKFSVVRVDEDSETTR